MENKYGFVIDTDQYSGNFERELTAYMTGIVGECEVGKNFVEEDISDYFEELIMQVADDNGTFRPCEVYKNNKESSHPNSSVIIYFFEKPTLENITILKERALQFSRDFKIQGFRLVSFITTITESEI